MAKENKKVGGLSRISLLHYAKLGMRSVVFVAALVRYIVGRARGEESPFRFLLDLPWLSFGILFVFAVGMLLRFFPSSFESMGCQKQFRRNYHPKTGVDEDTHVTLNTGRSTLAVLLFWLGLNGVIAALYFSRVIDAGILILVSLFYAVADMICILFFCPFQTWFMKNKCCGSCRIYNWDYAMMLTPLLLIPTPITWGLCGMSLTLLLFWEVAVWRHPERFSPATNDALSCANCREKLCQHKRQLRAFLKKNAARIRLSETLDRARARLRRNRKE